MKLTPWFPGDVAPAREGVYQRRYGHHEVFFCYWNGRFWGKYDTTPNAAEECAYAPSARQFLPWRGVEK